MAKTCQFAREKKRTKRIANDRVCRADLKKKIKDANLDWEEKLALVRKLDEMPRHGSPTRLRNRCRLTGRSRAYMRRFGISRIKFRDLASAGEIPGITKSSW
jgi:small subunit ribosomal protein S14